MWRGANISARAHTTDKKKHFDSLREDVRLLVPSVAYSISMLCGCLAIVITKLNHQVKCQRCDLTLVPLSSFLRI
jgi:hypothetical protein